MGMLLNPQHNFTIYDVPKGGGTTIRSWIDYAETGQTLLKELHKGYVSQNGQSYQRLKDRYNVCWFQPTTGKKIAIKRDPIKRFISCYKDKIIREGRDCKTHGWSVDKILDEYNRLPNHWRKHGKTPIGYLYYHFAPMVQHLGKDPSYYDQVFWLSEMDTKVKEYLEDMWKIKLPNLHCRNQKYSNPLNLTKKQKNKIREIYSIDYNIWC